VTYCLDAWAIISWRPALSRRCPRIEALLHSQQPVMSWINVGNPLPDLATNVGTRRTRRHEGFRPALILELPDEHRILQAATVKALHPVAYADAFAVATAVGRDAVLLYWGPEILAGRPIGRLKICVRAARHGITGASASAREPSRKPA
jgi:hypothetical protein